MVNCDTTCTVMDRSSGKFWLRSIARRAQVVLADFGEPADEEQRGGATGRRGWLRAAETPALMHGQDGRLQLAGPLDVTIYSRPGMPSLRRCKGADRASTQGIWRAPSPEINIDEDAQLRARYDHDVPVIFLGARSAAKHRVDPSISPQLRDNLSRLKP